MPLKTNAMMANFIFIPLIFCACCLKSAVATLVSLYGDKTATERHSPAIESPIIVNVYPTQNFRPSVKAPYLNELNKVS